MSGSGARRGGAREERQNDLPLGKRPARGTRAVCLVASSGQPARAQVESREGIALQNQILELRRQMQALQDQSGRGGGSPTYLGRGAYPRRRAAAAIWSRSC